MTKKPDHITLNFSEIFLDRLRSYADRHNQKLNAVLKEAFELLEDKETQERLRAEARNRLIGEDDPYGS